uniref:Peptidase S54 rhomboid domain-containing protein n=1 Tax=Clastoptera arizonana TaxID=38151 RepID=A0A1B6BZ94_9HEMI
MEQPQGHSYLRSLSVPTPTNQPPPEPVTPDPSLSETTDQVAPLGFRENVRRQHHPLQHQASMPVTSAEVENRRRVYRSTSKSEVVKNFIKRETAVFFGVHEGTEDREKARWLERRKRMCTRKYGQLKDEHQPCQPTVSRTRSAYVKDKKESVDGKEDVEGSPHWAEPPVRRKPSVAKMTFSGMAYVVATLSRHRARQSGLGRQWSRSYPPSTVPTTPTASSPFDDEVFFDQPEVEKEAEVLQPGQSSGDYVDKGPASAGMPLDKDKTIARNIHERADSWRRAPGDVNESTAEQVGMSRIWGRVLDRALDNSDRRQYGMGVVGRFFGRSLKRSVMNREPVKEQLEDLEDHRPFFTYWVTTVQILILFFSIFCYGLGPVGINLSQNSGLVLVTSLSLQQVEYNEPANFWIGARAADLIHLGAKFAPCMRKDAKIIKEIEKGREKERETACCIRNDDSGCVQSSQADCSKTISTWKKWSPGESGPGGRISGSVCGLDPKFCEAPASIAPYEWPDDITKWPICRKTYSANHQQQGLRQKDKMTAEHMVCEVIGHPCCIGIHGTCRITTREYCDFVHGYFHEEASLCSQVYCLDDVCGMIPFYSPEVPDQFYRLWTSLFLHAGVLHLAITLVLQWFLMRDLEKLTGSLRIMIIYMGSGVAGNLASAIFVPYRADVGPAGAQFGLLACLIVEVLNVWPMLRHPQHALCKLLAITFVLFLFGLLPWVDNFAHLFGFVFGFLLSYALLPFVSFGEYDRQKKIFLIWVCLMTSVFLFLLLVLMFYVIPVYDCEWCGYFNCLPLTRDLCATQNINFKREETVV